ncbi:hypothetical protein CHS0354_000531 [Potamilus streckersoni]|uniref:Probable DNA 3'-5' helicase RecG n=1 Tax=Potamilus streckersoni TaxID=2493646 RepID=A0AAE0T800_9BIVA|nr:hypothetical protein CHS0354_000531 [Potamilus streckersoni]
MLGEIGINTFWDFLNYFPRKYIDRSTIKSIGALVEGEDTTIVGEILDTKAEGLSWKKSRFVVYVSDYSGHVLKLIWFYGTAYLKEKFKIGDIIAAHGKVTMFGYEPTMTHPEIDVIKTRDRESENNQNELATVSASDYDLFNAGGIVGFYSTSEKMKQIGLTSKSIRYLMKRLLDEVEKEIPNIFSLEIQAQENLISFAEAYRLIHFPLSQQTLIDAKRTLKWTELFLLQFMFALRYRNQKKKESMFKFVCKQGNDSFEDKLKSVIPYKLTQAQQRAVSEINENMGAGTPMNRLLQGDVGSGKTIVAIHAMMRAVDNGTQCVLMAPTEILATQHFIVIKKLLDQYDLKSALVVGKQTKKLKQEIITGIENGSTQIVVGTHAVLESNVLFHKLGLVIIDEQHRFGVLQRKALQDKALSPHLLIMTATPIPRTLSMTLYGDLDVSVLNEYPTNRKKVITKVLFESERNKVYENIRQEVAKGRQVYVVYPLVEESEKIDLAAAVQEYERLKVEVFPEFTLGLIHVCTTVIEVGIDIPNASIIVIEHAERFGISQLHQLRGRVGRGEEQSYAYLIYCGHISVESKERLNAIESTIDGFKLAEIDFKLRGAGNILGTEQAGRVDALKIANLYEDRELLESARDAAFRLSKEDPQLRTEQNRELRKMYIKFFGRMSELINVG